MRFSKSNLSIRVGVITLDWISWKLQCPKKRFHVTLEKCVKVTLPVYANADATILCQEGQQNCDSAFVSVKMHSIQNVQLNIKMSLWC